MIFLLFCQNTVYTNTAIVITDINLLIVAIRDHRIEKKLNRVFHEIYVHANLATVSNFRNDKRNDSIKLV